MGDAVPPPLATAILAAVRKDPLVSVDVEAIDLCAGPGGWDEGARMLDPELHARIVGIEWDDAACLTREAAGHRTLKGDIAEVVPLTFRGAKGLIASPPCTLFSQAGSGVGRDLLDLLAGAIWRILHGDDCRAEIREAVYPTCHAAQLERNAKRVDKGKPSWSPEQISDAARADAYIACLVLEPARWIHDLWDSLEWLAFEQVPAVLPLWRIYVTALRKMGWSVWCGILNAADYGVPQTRTRAILIGRRNGTAHPPAATHAEHPVDDLFGDALPKWVSMSTALGWGMTARPSVTLVTGAGRIDSKGGNRGPLDGGSGARAAIAREQAEGRWRVGFGRKDDRGDSPDGLRERDFRDEDEPALTLTEKARSWTRELVPGSFADGRENGNRRPYGEDEPAPTLHFGNDAAGWRWRSAGSDGPGDGEQTGDVDDVPASVSEKLEDDGGAPDCQDDETRADLHDEGMPEGEWVVNTGRDWQDRGSGRGQAQTRPVEQPAPTVDTGGRWWVERPATTVQGDPRVFAPGHKRNASDPPETQGRSEGAMRVTPEEAGVLQSFVPTYPWQGNRTKVFEQIGNAVPPQLAAHVLGAAVGRTYTGGPVLAVIDREVPVAALRNNNQANAAVRSIDEPAGPVFFGARLNTVEWEPEQ